MKKEQKVITITDEAFYQLIQHVVKFVEKEIKQPAVEWVDAEEAKRLLNISSNTTLQGLRDTGAIGFTSVNRKNILYNKQSIQNLLLKNERPAL